MGGLYDVMDAKILYKIYSVHRRHKDDQSDGFLSDYRATHRLFSNPVVTPRAHSSHLRGIWRCVSRGILGSLRNRVGTWRYPVSSPLICGPQISPRLYHLKVGGRL